MIGRLMWLDNHDNWTEVTKPSLCDEVLVFDSALPAKYSGDEWEGTVVSYDEETGHYHMKNTMVTYIVPRFCFGEYEGFTFIIKKMPTRKGKNQ